LQAKTLSERDKILKQMNDIRFTSGQHFGGYFYSTVDAPPQ